MLISSKEYPNTLLITWLFKPTSIIPLALFRMAFGGLMFISTLRFILQGWISDFYVLPKVHFTYLGFGWVKPLPEAGMYTVFVLMLVTSLFVAFGLCYRLSILFFFLLFTYVELLDKTYYLNHYYFVSLLSFLLIFLPAHKAWSLDTVWNLTKGSSTIPAWMLHSVRLQLSLVYILAGIAKLNPDWLFAAQPLRIWLRANTELPMIGSLFDYVWVAYAMSWAGMVYDLGISFFLWWKKTRYIAYLAVILFHILTALLFPIGMFPWIMMVCTLIFFEADRWQWLQQFSLPRNPKVLQTSTLNLIVITTLFIFQLFMAFRHYLYPGNVLWTEEGYRFSWRVMLVEKTGRSFFTVTDTPSAKTWIVFPSDYLTPQQEKQMSFQPDMILQFAHYLRDEFAKQGHTVSVFTESFVSMNGGSSQPLVESEVDLAKQPYDLRPREWIVHTYDSK
jgi:hypothetical protein